MSDKGSVFQKGGGGTNFEQSVQTAFLTTLIIRGNAPCLPINEIIEVGFQNTNKGYATDDLLIVSKSTLGKHRLLIQIKHDISFTLGNEIFKEVIQSFWKDYNDASIFDKTKDKLIIVKNGLTKEERNHLKSLFNWASTHATETDFVTEVNRIKAKREKLEVFRECLKESNNNIALTDKEIWEFLKCSDVLEYDFLNTGSVDESYFLNLIKLSKKKESSQNEKDIWNDIFSFASKLNKDGGNVTTESVQQEELYKNFSIEKLNPYFKAVEKLRSDSSAILKPLKNTIGDLHINRLKSKEDIIDSLSTFQMTIVTGKPGAGKSSEIKDLLKDDFPKASIFVFRADQFNQPHIANVFSSQGVNETLQDIFSCISLIPDKILFIDSLEKLLEADPECAFKQLLGISHEFPNIKIITSSRKYAIDLIIQKFGLDKSILGVVELLPLDNEELNLVSGKYPQLVDVLKNDKIKALLQSPKYLDFAITALHKSTDNYSNISLVDFKQKLWNSLVVDVLNTKNGLPIKREKAFMEIAVKRAKEMKLFTQPEQSDAEAILTLEKDEIVLQEDQNRRYAPSHDILEDWALVRYVSTIYEDNAKPKDLFEKLGNEPAIRRAFRLWVEDYLLDDNSKVNNLIKATLNDDSIERYWTDELLIAVFKSENSSSFFLNFENELLENNFSFLNRCLHLIKTCCKESNRNFTFLIPIGSAWQESLLFINKHIDELNNLRMSVVNFLGDWNYKLLFQYTAVTEKEFFNAKAIVCYYINQIEQGDEFWQGRYIKEKGENLVAILFNLVAIAKDEISQIVERAFKNEEANSWKLNSFYENVIDNCLSGIRNWRLLKEMPELIIDTAWKEWKLRPIEEPPPGSIAAMMGGYTLTDGKCWGIEDKSDFFPPGIYKTPLYNLLMYHPLIGLKFIVDFINYSVNFYVEADCDYKHNLMQIEVELQDHTKKVQWGGSELWSAYRGTTVTHYALESLLISLEKFLFDTANKKTEISRANLKFMFDYALQNSNNVALTSVLMSVAIAYPQEVEEAMLPLLTVEEFYEWDLNRALQEVTSLCTVDMDLPFAQKECWESSQLPHRKKYTRGLRDFILDYQFNIRKLNKEIHEIFDKLKTTNPQEDIIWKKTLTEIDIRNHKVRDYNKELGGFIIQAEYDEDVNKFMESNRDHFEAEAKSMDYASQLSKAYENKEILEFSTWQICYDQYLSDNVNVFYDRPITLAVLGLRDFSTNTNETQKSWCINIIFAAIVNILKDTFDRTYSLSIRINIMEKAIALSSFHLLLGVITDNENRDEVIILIIYTLFAPFGEHEVKKNTEYLREVFFKQYPSETKIVWCGLIKYSQFRKSNPYFYDDPSSERLKAAKKKEDDFITNIVKAKELELNISDISLKNHEGYILLRAFVITPYCVEDQMYRKFILHFITLLVEDLKIEKTHTHRSENGRQIDSHSISNSKDYLADLLLNGDFNFVKSVLDLVLGAVYGNDPIIEYNQRDNLFDFSSKTIEYVIYKLDEKLNSTDEIFRKQLITNFWNIWEYFHQKIKASGKSYFTDTLFLDIKWNNTATHWLPLEGKKDFYHTIVNELGANKSQSLLNVFSTIGEKTFLPEGLSWLVEIYKNDELSATSLISPAAERLIKRLFYNHISKIKKNKNLVNDFVWLLNKMIDLGSSDAYLFRENVITYKQLN
jgi:hypothetical protein